MVTGVDMEQPVTPATPDFLATGAPGPRGRRRSGRPPIVIVAGVIGLLQVASLLLVTLGSVVNVVNSSGYGSSQTVNYPVFIGLLCLIGTFFFMVVNVFRGKAWAAYLVVAIEVLLLAAGLLNLVTSSAANPGSFLVGAAFSVVVVVGLLSSSARGWYDTP
jgi:hypothetical protein